MPTSHVGITVSGVTYPFIIRPESYNKVDIVDFAPRMATGLPNRSELGLYLDVGQESFAHGYGKQRFTEPESYSWSGHLVDTSHGFSTLYTNPTDVTSIASNRYDAAILHRQVMLIAATDGLYVVNSSGTLVKVWNVASRDIISNGTFFFITNSSRMRIGDVGDVGSATSNSITALVSPGWTVNMFAGGTIYIYEGTGSINSYTVASNTVDTIVISGTFSVIPNATSKFFVQYICGSATYQPENFYKLALFGGFVWACEYNVPWVHYWEELDGSDAEGQQGNDASAIHVGPGDFLINNMIPWANQLFVGREDGAWAIGDDNIAYHLLDFSDQAHVDNFTAMTVWNGFLYFSIRNTLYRYKSGLQDVTPPIYDEKWPVKAFGDFSSLVPRGKFLYLTARANDVNSLETTEASAFGVVLKTDDGATWHKVMDVAGATSHMRLFLNQVSDRLYFAYQNVSNTGYLKYISLQPLSELPYASFPTSGNHRLYLSYYDVSLMRISKSFASLTVDAELPAGTSIVASYRIDETSAITTLGTFTSSTLTLDFPTTATGKKIQIVLDLQSTSATATPLLRAVVLKLMARPDVKYGYNFEVLVESEQSTPDQGQLGMTSDETRAALELARASVAPITFIDIHGNSISSYLSSLRFMVQSYENEQGELAYTEEVARCTIVQV